MRLAWARSADASRNFGDELSPLIIHRLFGIRVKHSGLATSDMVALGSMMEGVEDLVADLRPYIWGTGFIKAGPQYRGADLRVRAVRGRLSLERLGSLAPASVALGDPGILANLAFPELATCAKRYAIGIIPHYVDQCREDVTALSSRGDVHVINVLAPVTDVLRSIAECEIVFSSSLHGLIVAESFAVPNYWTPLSSDVIGGRYKFDDFYSTFYRPAFGMSLREAVADADDLMRIWEPLPGVRRVQHDLLNAFPGHFSVSGLERTNDSSVARSLRSPGGMSVLHNPRCS